MSDRMLVLVPVAEGKLVSLEEIAAIEDIASAFAASNAMLNQTRITLRSGATVSTPLDIDEVMAKLTVAMTEANAHRVPSHRGEW